LIEKKGYRERSFLLLIQKKKRSRESYKQKRGGYTTTNPKRTTTNQLDSNKKSSQTQKQTSNIRQWLSPMTLEESQTSRATARAAQSGFKWQNSSKSPN
jgi:hypothetical protein